MIDTSKIPAPDNERWIAHKNGDTQNIIEELLFADQDFDTGSFCEFAHQFSDGKAGLKRLWKFVRHKIQYQEDAFGTQVLQRPAALWYSRVGDCKSKTLFVNAVLRCLGYNYTIRFASYGTPNVTHVYTVVHFKGKRIPLDAVHTRFGKEVKYSHKIDYPMTMIAHVSGPVRSDSLRGSFAALAEEYKAEAQKKLKEVAQKRGALNSPEFIPFSQLDEGTAKAKILLRQMEIQRVMKPEKAKVYTEAIAMTKRLIHNAGKGFTGSNAITGIVPDGMEPLARLLQNAMKDTTPAIQIRRNYARVGYSYSNTEAAMSYFDANKDFFLARGTEYNRNFSSTVPGTGKTMGERYVDVINQMKAENAFRNGQQQLFTVPGMNTQIALKEMLYKTVSDQDVATATTGNILASPAKVLGFFDQQSKEEFIDRIKAASGIYDEYLNEVFAEDTGIGNGFIYAYTSDVNINGVTPPANAFPGSVVTKAAFHGQWVSKSSEFSGLSYSMIKNMGRNSIDYTTGDLPEPQIAELLKAYNPNVGIIDPVSIGLIISGIVALVKAAVQIMGNAKQKAGVIEPEALPSDWTTPSGPALEFVGADWDGPIYDPTQNNGAGGLSTKNLMWGAAAAAGLYLLFQPSKD